ncbi:hypothetical protein NW762_003052 [Fusarium torreyae]|uniref:Uncharacterized protein n=1 Tax=Fusarium torreyae TaxID=1237075 RepID=A0A9W8SD59_9HYPO|nr:hypothetical protein NW762_003052 [Fusarium torreyae]
MTQEIPRPEPPAVKSNGFQVTHGRFSVIPGDIDRVDGNRLRELFDPDSLRLKRDQKEASEAARLLFKKPFFAGQLKHYGINFTSSAKMGDLRELLKNAVHQGQCDHVPESVSSLQQSMERTLQPLYQNWESDVREWDEKEKQRKQEALNRCTTAGEKAAYDLDLFLDHYFLTDGKPDELKTSEPLALEGFDQRMTLHLRAETIPGLHTVSGGFGSNRTLCIGWNRNAVVDLARSIDSRAREAAKRLKEEKWKEAMGEHFQYVSASTPKTMRPKGKGKQRFDLRQCQGSYIIKCDVVTDGWEDLAFHILTLEIYAGRDGKLTANYDFGIIEGAMLLADNEESLDAIAGTLDDSDDNSEMSDSEESGGEDEDEGREKKGRKRSLVQDIKSKSKAKGKDNRSTKRQKAGPSLSRRVFYRMRGRETGEGEIFSTPEPGQIDFLNDGCTKFSGLVYHFPYVSDNVEFSGYKISDSPKGKAEDWNDYSEAAYEYARGERWH